MLPRLLLLVLTLVSTRLVARAAEVSTPPERVRFGIQTGQQNVTWTKLLATWKEAEALGFDGAWVWDHLRTLATQVMPAFRPAR